MKETQALVINGILEYGVYDKIKLILNPDDFEGIYKPIFERYLELSEKLSNEGIYVDDLVLSRDLRSNPILINDESISSYYIEESERCVGSQSLKNHINLLKRENKARKIRSIIGDVSLAVEQNDFEFARKVLRKIDEEMTPKAKKYDYSELIVDCVESIDGEREPSIQLGFKNIDQTIGGLQRGNLIVLGGRTSQGKTSLAVNFAYNLALSGKKVLFVSLEMTVHEILKKIISLDTGISYEKIRSGWLTSDEREKIKDRNNQFYEMKELIVVDDAFTLGSVYNAVSGSKPDVVIIDFIQHMKFLKAENRAYQIEEIMKELKMMAKTEECAVIVLSQINRGSELGDKTGQPYLHNLKGSGSLEEGGDVVMLIHWPYKYDDTKPIGEVSLYIEKNRHGRTGMVNLNFDPVSGKYTEV